MELNKVAPPAIPLAPDEYSKSATDGASNVLRLFFNRLAYVLNALTGPSDTGGGGAGLYFPYGAFSSTQTQSVTAPATPTLVTLNSTDCASGMYRAVGDGVHVQSSGVYNVQFSCQITNDDTQTHEVDMWIRKNGVNAAWTASVVSVPGTHGGQPGYNVLAANFFVPLTAGDYIEFWWATNSTQVTLNALPAITSPFISPGAPSMVVTLSFVSRT